MRLYFTNILYTNKSARYCNIINTNQNTCILNGGLYEKKL